MKMGGSIADNGDGIYHAQLEDGAAVSNEMRQNSQTPIVGVLKSFARASSALFTMGGSSNIQNENVSGMDVKAGSAWNTSPFREIPEGYDIVMKRIPMYLLDWSLVIAIAVPRSNHNKGIGTTYHGQPEDGAAVSNERKQDSQTPAPGHFKFDIDTLYSKLAARKFDFSNKFTYMFGSSRSRSRSRSTIQNESGMDMKVEAKAGSVRNISQVWDIPSGQAKEVWVKGSIITHLVVTSKDVKGHEQVIMMIPRDLFEKNPVVVIFADGSRTSAADMEAVPVSSIVIDVMGSAPSAYETTQQGYLYLETIS